MVSMCSSTNNEVAAAAFTCLNSLVFAPQHDSIPIGQINKLKHIYLNNGLGNIAKVNSNNYFYQLNFFRNGDPERIWLNLCKHN
jgi:hypothetical protein